MEETNNILEKAPCEPELEPCNEDIAPETEDIAPYGTVRRDELGRVMKGSVLNAKGRGTSLNMTTILKNAMEQVSDKHAGADPDAVIIVRKVIEEAKNGNFNFVKLIWEYADGKPVQRIDHTSGGEGIAPMSKEQLDKLDKLFAKEGGIETLERVRDDVREALIVEAEG